METKTRLKIKPAEDFKDIFVPELADFLVELHQRFNDERLMLLKERQKRQSEFDNGILPGFLSETESIRNTDWVCSPLPGDLLDRRVEITGPVDRKMIINALNSGASTFMADFEDSNSPTWKNCMQGQINLSDAINRTIDFTSEQGKTYRLHEKTSVLLVRPRGLHLPEKHIEINGEEASGSLTDFGIYFFRNGKKLLENGSAPYFYLPKLEHYKEARWWNDVFIFAQDYFQIPRGTVKATVLVETITASFQIDEILYELRAHSSGLNCGRWDYIFSFIKKFRNLPELMIPDRDQVTMASPFMDAYSKRVIEVCHRRNVHAIGGMAAQIPVKNDDEVNRVAFDKIRKDKEREVKNGHDGTWVAHPALVAVAREIFDQYMPDANQIDKKFEYHIGEEALLKVPEGDITEKGVRKNINIGILYLESWLMGIGAAAIYNLMEDAATAEISRTQIWQWLKNEALLSDGRILTREMVLQWELEEMENIEKYVDEERFRNGKFNLAKELFNELIFSGSFEEFLTLKAYPFI
ncbi:malate synthase A [Chryseobacterium gossypii]|uniref:malate synthase A n=1 Tax=Chryseobacterium gossypii TaxID=3231602 RepID=UPI003524E364